MSQSATLRELIIMSNTSSTNEAVIPLEDITECVRLQRPPRFADSYQVSIADQNLTQQSVCISDPVPTGRQILEASNRFPAENFMLLMRQATGNVEEIGLSETVNVYQQGVEQFIAFEVDRLFYFELNGRRLPWGDKFITENILRILGGIDSNQSLWLTDRSAEDKMLNDADKVNLSKKGLEIIYSKAKSWKLNVHGVVITSDTPTILASVAMIQAGFDPSEDWNLILKVKGQPKKPISTDDEIDLTHSGIEKLRLMRKEIVNGEKPIDLRSEFVLLDKDTKYLNALEVHWETLLDGSRRWLIIKDFQLPNGYNQEKTDIAIDIPPAYPDAALDMFYCNPPLNLKSGAVIAQTNSQQAIAGSSYQRWSRHLAPSTRWNPKVDSVITQMTVVEESLLREVGQ